MLLNKNRAPLFEALHAHRQLQTTAYHVPGHKQRASSWMNEEASAYYEALLSLDVTELSDTDDLHHPQGPLDEAQKLAAQCYHAEETCFLVGGSTVGNLAMILAHAHPGELFIVQRNVHKSIVNGLMLAGASAVLLPPLLEPLSGLATIPSLTLLEEALIQHPEAKGVIITTPNYYGLTPKLDGLIDLVHSFNLPVFVDEAHGAHYGFHPSFPTSALQAGADLVVQSTHKMLSAMTMGAMLHMQGSRVNKDAVKQALRMVQSSSPSFPLLASLDLARQQLDTSGEAAFQPALEAVEIVVQKLIETPFRALGYADYYNSELSYDPLKMVLFDESGIITGFELRDELLKHHCIAEMADSRYVVMAFGTGSSKEDGTTLIHALLAIAKENNHTDRIQRNKATSSVRQKRAYITATQAASVPPVVSFNRVMHTMEQIKLEDSAGFTCAEWIIPYPPGIPILFPGEIITSAIIGELQLWRHSGAQIQGAQDSGLTYIQVQAIVD